MKDKIVVKRYGDAFINFCKEGCGIDKAFADLRNIRNIIRENPEFMIFLEAPDITLAEKNDFLEKILSGGYTDEFKHFLKLLLEKNRIDKLIEIAEYIRITYSHGNEVEAVLKTSYFMDLETIRRIQERLEEKFQKKLKLYIDLDGSLLGGVQVTIGNTVIDGSVRRRLDELREKLETVRV